jgi:hypothetical protein
MKREIRLETTDVDANTIPEEVSILFVFDDVPVGGATALINPDGTIKDVMIGADLDGDGRIDTTDDQIMCDLATAFLQVKW